MGAGHFVRSRRQWNQLYAQLVTSGSTHHHHHHHHRTQQQSHLPPAQLESLLVPGRLGHRRTSTSLWNAILRSCSLHLPPSLPIHLYRLMRYRGDAFPDAQTFALLFAACSLSTSLAHAQAFHAALLRCACYALVGSSLIRTYSHFGLLGSSRQVFDEIVVVSSARESVIWATMVGVYVKAGRMGDAHRLLDEMPARNVVSWTSVISGYAHSGRDDEAIRCFQSMLADGVSPDPTAMVSVLPACGRMGCLHLGKWIHSFVLKSGMQATANLSAALIGMYAKSGEVSSARRVFDLTEPKPLPLWNAIVDAYCKVGEMGTARTLFDQMGDRRDRFSFNSMIAGYVRESRPTEALHLFSELRAFSVGLGADEFATAGALTACANLGVLQQGRALHAMILVDAVKLDTHLGTALLNMYAKCGRIDHASMVFERMEKKDGSAWTAMISALAMHGKERSALLHLSSMLEQGIRPNSATYVSVLDACSHSGLLNEGLKHLDGMRSRYGIEPKIEHYGCMVDLLGRRGFLREAEELVRRMGLESDHVMWNSLLAACKVHGVVDVAERVANRLLLLRRDSSCQDDGGAFVQLHNIYLDGGRWKDASEMRLEMEKRGVRKTAGWSSITIAGGVHIFSAGDTSHPEIAEIENTLGLMMGQMSNLAGYTCMIPGQSKISSLFFS